MKNLFLTILLINSFRLFLAQIGYKSPQTCPNYECSSDLDPKSCYKKFSNFKIEVSDTKCIGDQVCELNDLGEANCITKEVKKIKIAYPGELCDIKNSNQKIICAYGQKSCHNKLKRCLGFEVGQFCEETSDCNPQFYCEDGICTPKLPNVISVIIFQFFACSSDSNCQRSSFCYFSTANIEMGICTPYLSIENEKIVSRSYKGKFCI